MVQGATTQHEQPTRLHDWLRKAATRRSHDFELLVHQLGGDVLTRWATPQACRQAARYLHIPAVVAMLASNRITIRDFQLPQQSQVARMAGAPWPSIEGVSLAATLDCPALTCLMPSEVWHADEQLTAFLLSVHRSAPWQPEASSKHFWMPQLLQGFQDAAMVACEVDEGLHMRQHPGAARWMAHRLGERLVVVRCAMGEVRLADFYTDAGLVQAQAQIAQELQAPNLLMFAPAVAAFAAVLAGLDMPRRGSFAELIAHGPPEAVFKADYSARA